MFKQLYWQMLIALTCWSTSRPLTRSPVVIWVRGINTDPSYVAWPWEAARHPDLQGHKGRTALEHQHGHRWQFRPSAIVRPLGATRATDINTSPGYGRNTDLDVAPGGNQATHISLLLIPLTSSVSPLPTAHELLSFSLPFPHKRVAHRNSARWLSSTTQGQEALGRPLLLFI